MKKRFADAAFLILTAILFVCFSHKIQFSGTLTLNGRTLSEPIKVIRFLFENRDDAIIPLIQSYEYLGYVTTWEGDTICHIENDNEEYVLDLSKMTFISVKDRRVGENLLTPPPGENHGVILTKGKEVYVNTGVFVGMQQRLGIPAHLSVNLWNRQVSITVGSGQINN